MYALYSFSFVYILYSTAVIWRINFIIVVTAVSLDYRTFGVEAAEGEGYDDCKRCYC